MYDLQTAHGCAMLTAVCGRAAPLALGGLHESAIAVTSVPPSPD